MYIKRAAAAPLGFIALWINSMSPVAAASLPEALAGECPGDYQVKPGLNVDWALSTLASFPKGSHAADFRLSTPPEGYSCKLGRFTDHY